MVGGLKMNKEINHGSIEELISLDEKKRREKMSPEAMKAWRKRFNEQMEKYDPSGKRVHEIAKKYGQKES